MNTVPFDSRVTIVTRSVTYRVDEVDAPWGREVGRADVSIVIAPHPAQRGATV
jgi:hypothetical protein